ncbi:TraC family protein [Thalassotalea piscium]|uniref:Conjugal transfer ATP-binding protein TraC n=1 Tax=Thalassotalea piscium TaxID=1230533 RepID=A0A7X0NGQ8_9GAMM|nr:conjugal transfer ATP-binding protein TraC [Thalassotalea piscium]
MFPTRTYDPESELFWSSDSVDTSALSAIWLCHPLPGVSEDAVSIINSMISNDIPKNSVLSISLVSSTFVAPIISYFRSARRHVISDMTSPLKAQLAKEYVDNRIALFESGVKKPLDVDTKVLLKDKYLLITLKLNIEDLPEEDDFHKVKTLATSFEQTFESLNLYPQRVDNEMFLMLMRGLIYPGKQPSKEMDEYKELNEQIFDLDTHISVDKDKLVVGEHHVRSLSVQQYPQNTALPIMSFLVGDPKGSQNQISCPFILTTHLYFPDVHSAKQSIDKKAKSTRMQNLGKLGRLVPRIGIKDENFTHLTTSLEEGSKPVFAWTNLLLFAQDQETLTKQSSQAKNFYEVHGFKLSQDTFLQGPCFQQQLPTCINNAAVKFTRRFCTMTAEQACHLLPIVADWKGNGLGSNNLFYSRRGQVVVFDPFDTDTNMNGCVFGESGSGKSVLLNDIAMGVYSRGGQVRIIDSGRSYKKTTETVHGEFIEFAPNVQIILNPFTDVIDINAELPSLKVILEQMAAPKDGLSDYQMSQLEKITLEAWNVYQNQLNITILSELIIKKGAESNDEDIRKMGEQFFPYNRHGNYGKYFDGDANLTMSGDWSVLELDDLTAMKELRTVVLLLLISKLNKDFYNGDRAIPKILIVDEYWKFGLDDDQGSERIQKFMIGAFRLFRKYNAASFLGTQSPLDLAPDGNSPILQNAANVIVMKQKTESVEALKRNGILALTDYTFDLMKTVRRKGSEYSDLFIYTSGRGFGIARFVIDRFTQLLYTTDAKETAELNMIMSEGHNVVEAIKIKMGREGS